MATKRTTGLTICAGCPLRTICANTPKEREELKMKPKIPDYYPTMFLDGYEPWEILAAAHKKFLAAAAAQTPAEPQEDYNINIKSEVKVKK